MSEPDQKVEDEGSTEERKSELIVEEKPEEEAPKKDEEEEDGVPPALPPRPPPRPRQPCTCGSNGDEPEETIERRVPRSCWSSGLRKYVFLCTACGSLSILLGALFLTVYFMLKSYTSSLNHFETIPTYVPSGMLIATGFLIICLACRKNRNSFLMKLCGLCSLCCAVLCVSVTVTTTVIHMNRLQTLRECLYTLKTQSCTCYSVLMDNDRMSDEGIKFVFNSTPDCEVIHGALYSCLRAIFGLSVIGILVCIFSCMLVYQLLSHEKKKMYWAQLEMRCRYLYRQQRNPHYYSCCEECRYPPHPHELFPWDLMANRFWSTGRMGNLYTPNPEDRGNHNRLRSGWNWRRLPWNRSTGNTTEPTRASLGSPDSQYGFSSTPAADGAPYTVLDPRTPAVIPGCHPGLPGAADITDGGFYSWGPPPPYASNRNSANNSPARRSLGDLLHQMSPIRRNDNVSPARGLHHVHRHHLHRQCGSTSRQGQVQSDPLQKTTPLRTAPITNAIQQQQAGMDPLWSNSLSSVQQFQKVIQNKGNYENMYESENVPPTTGFNTLPSLKKRNTNAVFQDETSTAYFFSSAENLGCSTSNIEVQNRTENLPPRVFLTNSQPNTSRYSPGPNGTNISDPQQTVRKLLLNCSPAKPKPEPQVYSAKKKLGPKEDNENVITFHYRVGIPRSPNIQNFSQFTETESGKIPKGMKYVTKDVELLQKHSNLMKEFSKRKTSKENEPRNSYQGEEYPKTGENESDVYFGDISNSSCYNDALYEDAEVKPRYTNGLLNKQNLKMIECNSIRKQKRFCSNYSEGGEEKGKYFNPYRQQESNDEQSSGSMTADSGISSGRSFLPNNLGDFSHPLFQKPKALPRGSRYKKKLELEESESGCDESESQGKRKRSVPKPKTGEEVSNQLLSTCSLSLSNEDGPKEEGRKSPKPLPRTSVPTKKEKTHFLAPDAQYEPPNKLKDAGRCKPAVPARPLNLQKMYRTGPEGGCSAGRRRQPPGEEPEGSDAIEIGTHSVNV